MAVRTDANHSFVLVICILSRYHAVALSYSQDELLDIRKGLTCQLPAELYIPPEMVKPAELSEAPAAERRRSRRCKRKQKRGKQAGIIARLTANPFKPPLLTLFLANA